MVKNMYNDNPFVECTARDMSYKEVSQYWCSPFECYNIDERMLFNSLTPIIIEGARGSGKTMILKYLSYFCQKEYSEKNNKELLETLLEKNSIGFYFRYSDNFGALFKSLNCLSEEKEKLFMQYYELYICDEIINVVSDMHINSILSTSEVELLCEKISEIFDCTLNSLAEIQEKIQSCIRDMDLWIRKSRYIKTPDEELKLIIKYNDIVVKFCTILRSIKTEFYDINFTIIIDEYENAAEYQILLNSLLKQVDAKIKVTYRIGVRPQGMVTMETRVGNEFLQINRDYILCQLRSDNMLKYKKFIANIANIRLNSNQTYVELGLTNIEELLGKKEDLVKEAIEILNDREKKHFNIIKHTFDSDEDFKEGTKKLENDENPLAEMLNILWRLRGISVDDISMAMNNYFSGNYNLRNNTTKEEQLAYKYKLDYVDKYKYQLLFVLLSVFKRKKKYYSFNTFAYLSSGSVNDFICLCRKTFYALTPKYFGNLSVSKQIPADIQAKGAEETAIEQMDKVQMCSDHGTEMFTFAMNMGEYFRDMNKDINIKYPETNQFAFENQTEILDDAVYKSLIKWGVIIRKARVQSITIGAKKGYLYHLNRIFSPIFDISYRTRGGFNFVIPKELYRMLISETLSPKNITAKKKAIQKKVQKSKNK